MYCQIGNMNEYSISKKLESIRIHLIRDIKTLPGTAGELYNTLTACRPCERPGKHLFSIKLKTDGNNENT